MLPAGVGVQEFVPDLVNVPDSRRLAPHTVGIPRNSRLGAAGTLALRRVSRNGTVAVVNQDRRAAGFHVVGVEGGPFPPAFSQVREESTVRRRPSMCAGVRPGCRRRCRQRPCLLCGLPIRSTGTRPAGAGGSLLGRAASPDQGSPGAAKAHVVTLAPGLGGPWGFLVRLRGPAGEGPTRGSHSFPCHDAPAHDRRPLPPPREGRGVGQSPTAVLGLACIAGCGARADCGPEAGAAARSPGGRRVARMRGALNP